jgi:hypothetical protein
MWTDNKFSELWERDEQEYLDYTQNRPRGQFNIEAKYLQCGDLMLMSSGIQYRVVRVIIRDAGFQVGRSLVVGGKKVYITIESLDGEMFQIHYWNGEETIYQLEPTTEFFLDSNHVVGIERE